jgi:hypothetical protein
MTSAERIREHVKHLRQRIETIEWAIKKPGTEGTLVLLPTDR